MTGAPAHGEGATAKVGLAGGESDCRERSGGPARPFASAVRDAADRRWLRLAARIGLRGHGGAEPNPCVGAVIVDPRGSPLGAGHHRRCGQAHAEVEALADARRRGHQVRGATMYVTLEPCHRQGRTGPCTEAIVEAGLSEVVVARRDPHPKGDGGLERLAAAGVAARLVEEPTAARLGAPFASRVISGLPWVVAKWAQTIDGRLATRVGDSRWISSPRSRSMVHRERGRVDAILTGIGTVLADDPLLTAREVRVRRVARRVVVDPSLRIPLEARMLASLEVAPLTVACARSAAQSPKAEVLRARGVEIVALPTLDAPSAAEPTLREAADDRATAPPARCDLRQLLRSLATNHGAATVLVEAGPRLLGSLLAEDLVDMAWIFVAPLILADREAPGPQVPAASAGIDALRATTLGSLRLIELRRRGPDAMLLLERPRGRAAWHDGAGALADGPAIARRGGASA